MTTYVKKNKTLNKVLKVSLVITLLFAGAIAYGVYWAFFDMNRLPKGDYLNEKLSPDGHYTLKAYLTNGGATTSYAVRAELIFNEGNKKAKNIYWNAREDTANIIWIDNDTVEINGHSLDVPNDKYDFRHQ